MKKIKIKALAVLLILSIVSSSFVGCEFLDGLFKDLNNVEGPDDSSPISLDSIPAFDGTSQYVVINGNVPFFTDEKCDESYESFSPLDELGRCGVAISCIWLDLMPTEPRDEIGHVKPSGWHSVQYDVVPGRNLYNRCHLIGFQLTGENDNEKNLITGTRDMNNEGMLPFENMVADYVKDVKNHVLYRVTPIYEGNNLVASGVLMEARSVEDEGEGIQFCVYVYNAQSGVVIDYKTGESRLADDPLGDLVNSGHDDAEILPAAVPDSIDAIYEETVNGEFSGCLIVVVAQGYAGNIILAVDIDENGKVIEVYTVSEQETHGKGNLSDYMSKFAGAGSEGIDEILLVSGATVTSSAIKNAVKDALTAFKCYTDAVSNGKTFVINISSEKFHAESCSYAQSMSETNKLVYVGFAADLVKAGYTPCGVCKPDKN